MRITSKVIALIKGSPICQAEIAMALNVKMSTIETYLRNNDEQLTLAASIDAISRTLKIDRNKILEKIPA